MHGVLERFFQRFCDDADACVLQREWVNQEAPRRPVYHRALDFLGQLIADGESDPPLQELQRQLFLELESFIQVRGGDDRHSFIVVIPVADRPRHLQACLASLLHQCRRFGYGGHKDGNFRKVSVLIADDSKQAENIRCIRDMAADFAGEGLRCHYFGQDEQRQTVQALAGAAVEGIVGTPEQTGFQHKGASVMRNIASLKLRDLSLGGDRQLFYFIDSDQEFATDSATGAADCTLNYFHYLDRLFSETDAEVLTGKVVGDPPVSPAVMAGNLLQDVMALMARMARLPPGQSCQFHAEVEPGGDDAGYHDMADLFGFKSADTAMQYHCPLHGPHDQRAAFTHFTGLLSRFFDGEHPTRKTLYQHCDVLAGVAAARTVYTGNYVLKPEALRFFIPFATLKLRMAGPVLGRLIRGEIGGRFVSANLPMLHRRTVADMGRSEFRPDIQHRADAVDLSGEFERQYFGDVMLFSLERLTESGFPVRDMALQEIAKVVDDIEQTLYDKYQLKREHIQERLAQMESSLNAPAQWWNQLPEMADSRRQLRRFIDDIEHNFGAQARGYHLIQDLGHKRERLRAITRAIARYPDERVAWQSLLERPLQ